MKDMFITWYKLTHWGYLEEWFSYDDGRFLHPETQAMFIAYRAGYNKHKKDTNKKEPAPGYCKHCKQYTIEEPLKGN